MEVKVCIYTTNLGRYDFRQEHTRQSYPTDLIHYEDNDELLALGQSFFMQNMAYRCFPWQCRKLQPYDLAIYLDANVEIISETFIAEVVAAMEDKSLGVSRHHLRDCAYKELDVCERLPKYYPTNTAGYRSKYLYERLPAHSGLYWCGFLAHNMHAIATDMLDCWWNDMNSFTNLSPQSQASFAYSVWKTKPNLHVFPAEYFETKWFIIQPHRKRV